MSESTLYQNFCRLAENCIRKDINDDLKDFLRKIEDQRSIKDFTEMQKKVFSDEDFWDTGKNVIIQGATSAGKTLTAEIDMAYQIYCKNKKIIYLVPLKALASEKYHSMKKIFSDKKSDKKVYYSTSDYQNNDVDIVQNDYDIAIMVYEKFYSLISQNYEKFPNKALGLLVIDELHMLNDEERGPKLEFSVEKLRTVSNLGNESKHKIKGLSILALTTSECNAEKVREWLGKERTKIILNENRPVKIEERFIYLDPLHPDKATYKCYNMGEEITEKREFQLNNQIVERKNPDYTLLQIIANEITKENNKQIIVFCNSKRLCTGIAKKICDSGILKRDKEPNNFPSMVDSDMEQRHYDEIAKYIKQYAVAYHNARLPVVMREYIESEFRERNIRILVATETLTMGINMPTDVLICYGNKVYRNDDDFRKMNYQEYKNIIGRCGRLGMAGEGISYMIACDEDSCNENINLFAHKNEKQIIKSGLAADAETSAPYYLNLFDKTISEKILGKKISTGLYQKSSQPDMAEKIIDLWIDGRNWLLREDSDEDLEDDDDTAHDITKFGNAVRRFALSMTTFKKIHKYFFDEKTKTTQYTMPKYDPDAPYTILFDGNEETKNYLLAVLWTVCRQMEELSGKKQYLNLNGIDDWDEFGNKLLKFIRENVSPQMYWNGSLLEKYMTEKDELNNDNTILALYRALVLYYWIQGYTVTAIREKLGLPSSEKYYIYTSELKSFGEVCAYILEAISASIRIKGGQDCDALATMFYRASICVKYGMGVELSRIASRHIRGVSRQKLLDIQKDADKSHSNVIAFLYYKDDEYWKTQFNEEQRTEIKDIIYANYEKDINIILENLFKDGVISETVESDYNNAANYMSVGAWKDVLYDLHTVNIKLSDISEKLEKDEIRLYIFHTEIYEDLEINGDSFKECGSIIRSAVKNRDEDYFIIFRGRRGYQPDDIVKSAYSRLISADDFSRLIIFPMFERLKCNGRYGNHLVNIIKQVIEALGKKNFEDIKSRQEAIKKVTDDYIFNAGKTTEEKQEEKPAAIEPVPAPVNSTINLNVKGNVYIDQSKTYNCNYTQINNILTSFNNIPKITSIRAENEDDRAKNEDEIQSFMDTAQKVITDQVKLEDVEYNQTSIEEFVSGKIPEYKEIISCLDETLKQSLNYALYIHQMFTQAENIQDFSPASVMYGKFLENYLKTDFIRYLQQKKHSFKLSVPASGGGYKKITAGNLSDDDIQKTTLGTFGYACGGLKGSDDSFEKLENILNNATNIRNKSCHKGDEPVTSENIEKLRTLTFQTVELLHSLI